MTDDFREGLISGYDRTLDLIKSYLAAANIKPDGATALQCLAEDIRRESEEADRA